MEKYPHRRWFLDHYRLPPSDPRYLSMTDDEIVFDYLTMQARQQELETLNEEVAGHEGQEQGQVQVPEFEQQGGQNKVRTIQFAADAAAFQEWLAAEGSV